MHSVVVVPGPTVIAQIVADSVTTQINVTPGTTLELTLPGTPGPPGPPGPQGLPGSLSPNPTVESLTFTTNTAITATPGMMTWNEDSDTVVLGLPGGESVDLGLELKYHVRAAQNLVKGDVVYASGTIGASGKIEVSKYIANNTIEVKYLLGVVVGPITAGEFGYISSFGIIKELNTTGGVEAWVNGTVLYASPTTAGAFTSVLPIAPNQDIPVAIVIRSAASNGIIFVRPTQGFKLNELHDVFTAGATTGQFLRYGTNRWEAQTLSSLNLNNIILNTSVTLTAQTTTLATTTQTQIASFAAATFRSAKLTIQAYNSVTGVVQISEILIAHNGTTVSSTEYNVISTGAIVANYVVDINSGNVRLLATGTSANSTQYKISQTLIGA